MKLFGLIYQEFHCKILIDFQCYIFVRVPVFFIVNLGLQGKDPGFPRGGMLPTLYEGMLTQNYPDHPQKKRKEKKNERTA